MSAEEPATNDDPIDAAIDGQGPADSDTDSDTGSTSDSGPKGERIAKRMAGAGLCSRREAERWISDGRVSVNGKVISSAALNVTDADEISVDGESVGRKQPLRLFRYHKPNGLVTSHNDPEGRPTVFDKLPRSLPRVISVGRLDLNSEGLLLLTTSGDLSRQLELPSNNWTRRYRVRAFGRISQDQLDQLKDGINVDGVQYGPIEAVLEPGDGKNRWIQVSLKEGKNREVRNVLGTLGLTVNRLIRVAYGPFKLSDLKQGEIEEVPVARIEQYLGGKLEMPDQIRRKEGWAKARQKDKGRTPKKRSSRDDKRTGEQKDGDRQNRPNNRTGNRTGNRSDNRPDKRSDKGTHHRSDDRNNQQRSNRPTVKSGDLNSRPAGSRPSGSRPSGNRNTGFKGRRDR